MRNIELNIQMFASNASEEKETYGVDENYNKVEVYSKEDIDNKKQNKVLSGTNNPSDSLGEDGDVYLQYE